MDSTKSIIAEFDKWHTLGTKTPFEPAKTISDGALEQIKQMRPQKWNALTNLNLSRCRRITDASLRYLPSALRTLDVSHTHVTGHEFNRGYSNLTQLNLSCTKISNTTVTALPRELVNLSVSHTDLSIQGLNTLPHKLQHLNIRGCKYLTKDMIAKHTGRLGDCYRRDQLLKITKCRGYIWSFTKPGKPTHYYGGVMHMMSKPMFDALHRKAISKCHHLLTERGHGHHVLRREFSTLRRARKTTGYPVCLEDQIAIWATKQKLPLDRLGNDQLVQAVYNNLKADSRRLINALEPLRTLSSINMTAKQWIEGDLQLLVDLGKCTSPVYLVEKRNTAWIKKIRKLLNTSKVPVGIFPGAGHTLGTTGIKTQLEKDGWQFTRL